VSGNINKVTKQGMHGVILLLHIVEVVSILVDSVLAEYVLQKEESIIVRVLNGRGVIEHSNIRVYHFIISDEKKGGNKYWLISALFVPGDFL